MADVDYAALARANRDVFYKKIDEAAHTWKVHAEQPPYRVCGREEDGLEMCLMTADVAHSPDYLAKLYHMQSPLHKEVETKNVEKIEVIRQIDAVREAVPIH